MAQQLLVNVFAVGPLGAGASVTIAHGLKSDDVGVTPTQVLCDRASPLVVSSCNDATFTVTNPTGGALSAVFRAEYDHSIHATGATPTKWSGAASQLPPNGPAGGDLYGLYPLPRVGGFAGNPIDGSTQPVAGDFWQYDGSVWRHVQVAPGTPTAVWAQFSDSTDQALSGTPLDLKFNTKDGGVAGITAAIDPMTARASRLTVSSAGVYAFTISPQLEHFGGGGAELVSFYAVTDSGTVTNSASYSELSNNNRGTLPYLELILPMTAGGWLQWWMASTPGTNIRVHAIAAAPPVPAAPSVIAGVKLIGV